ncbi:MAG: hypothetical protein WCP28_19215 [Actinomycetes bacterium]
MRLLAVETDAQIRVNPLLVAVVRAAINLCHVAAVTSVTSPVPVRKADQAGGLVVDK